MHDPLFQPLAAGDLALRNRVVMAPMTRSRADESGRVGPMTATYYAQRAGAGLILTEGIYPEPMGKGYVRTPGLADEGHAGKWRLVTDAVHARGGLIVAQLMHAGRISDPSFLPEGSIPVAPSAIRPRGTSYTDAGPREHVTPRALSSAEVTDVIDAFAAATARALAAGFDGVELHAGSGYLPMQFLSTGTNRRTDRYGGGTTNRIRFVVEALEAMAAVAGPGRVGLRITPEMTFNDIVDEAPADTYRALVDAIDSLRLAFLDVGRHGPLDVHALLRPRFGGAYFAGVGLTGESAARMVAEGAADAAIFGKAFVANPDLPARLARGAPIAPADPATFYTPGARGYIDYPPWDPTLARRTVREAA